MDEKNEEEVDGIGELVEYMRCFVEYMRWYVEYMRCFVVGKDEYDQKKNHGAKAEK